GKHGARWSMTMIARRWNATTKASRSGGSAGSLWVAREQASPYTQHTMEQEPLHGVDRDDADNDSDEAAGTVPPGVVPCRECTILIGPGYLEREPFPH